MRQCRNDTAATAARQAVLRCVVQHSESCLSLRGDQRGKARLSHARFNSPLRSKAPQPGFDFVVGHHVISGEKAFLGKKHDPPMQTSAALEQILAEPPDSEAGVPVGKTEALGQRNQAFRNLFPVGRAQLPRPLSQAGMDIDPHSLPVKGRVCLEARAFRTSAFTVFHARSACFSSMPYSCSA